MRTRWIWLAIALAASSGTSAQSRPAAAGGGQPFRLCVLDQAAMIQRSQLAQNMGARFQQVRRQTQAKIEEDRRTLEADARALDGLRASIPPAVAKTRDAEIARRRAALKERGEQANRTLAALDSELTANIAKLSEPVIRAVEAERGCSMLIASSALLHLRDASLDITALVIERLNAAPVPQPR